MARVLLVPSLPLSQSTRQAWRNAGGTYSRRGRSVEEIMDIATRNDWSIINLGNSRFQPAPSPVPVHNHGLQVKFLTEPLEVRAKLGALMPSPNYEGPGYYWEKGAGYGGRNKSKFWIDNARDFNEIRRIALFSGNELQQHVVGTEYRVVTVGNKVVQGNIRYGDNGDRTYEWVGVSGLPPAVKARAKEAAELAFTSDRTVIAWDLIETHSGTVYLFEGNACPGVNDATANRIVDAVLGVSYAATA